MAISYNKLWKLLIDKKMTQAELRKAADIATNTMTKLRRDEQVNLSILGKVFRPLSCYAFRLRLFCAEKVIE